jgi:hypothetical protein
MRDRWLTVLVAVGVVALLVGAVLGVAALRSDGPETSPAPVPRAAPTKVVTSAQGGLLGQRNFCFRQRSQADRFKVGKLNVDAVREAMELYN